MINTINVFIHSNHIIIISSSKGCVRALSCSLISSCPLEKRVISDFSISSLHLWLWVFTYDDWFHILFSLFSLSSKGQILQEVLFRFYYLIDIHWNILRYIALLWLFSWIQWWPSMRPKTQEVSTWSGATCHLPPVTCHLPPGLKWGGSPNSILMALVDLV